MEKFIFKVIFAMIILAFFHTRSVSSDFFQSQENQILRSENTTNSSSPVTLNSMGWHLRYLGALSAIEVDNLMSTQIGIHSIWGWSSSTNSWEVRARNILSPPEFPKLTTLQAGKGYWFFINNSVTLPVASSQPALELPQRNGWHLLGTKEKRSAQSFFDYLPKFKTQDPGRGTIWFYTQGQWFLYANGSLPAGHFLENFPKLIEVPANAGFWVGMGVGANLPPMAVPLSITANASTPLQQLQLSGYDEDGDTIRYDLASSTGGIGYTNAELDENGLLNFTITPGSK